jgi:pimeloyl-ACP methyl ester carboxylesterase
MAQAPITTDFASRDGRRISALLTPGERGAPGVVILHGYGSRKESHRDFGELLAARGMWSIVPDLRGHGATGGPLGGGMTGDVLAALDTLAEGGAGRLGIRGSSMGGFLALAAAPLHPAVRAVVAICPAQPGPLARRLEHDWPLRHPLDPALWRHDGIARGFWHATADDTVPWQDTFHMHARCAQPKHLRIEMGGGHQSLQHDPATQQATADFLERHLTTPATDGAAPGKPR